MSSPKNKSLNRLDPNSRNKTAQSVAASAVPASSALAAATVASKSSALRSAKSMGQVAVATVAAYASTSPTGSTTLKSTNSLGSTSTTKRSSTEISPSAKSASSSASSVPYSDNTYCSASSCDCKQQQSRRGSGSSGTSIATTTCSTSTRAGSNYTTRRNGFTPSLRSQNSSNSSGDDMGDTGSSNMSMANRLRSKRVKIDLASSNGSFNEFSWSSVSNDLSSMLFSTSDTSLNGSNSFSESGASNSSHGSSRKSMTTTTTTTTTSSSSSRPLTRSRMATVRTVMSETPASMLIEEAAVVSNPHESQQTALIPLRNRNGNSRSNGSPPASHNQAAEESNPANGNASSAAGKKCQWFRCNYVCGENLNNNNSNINANSGLSLVDEFIEHVKQKHIQPQKTFHKYRCLWSNCPVYGSLSLSRTWLERHVIDHVDKYPYPCIFNGCARRFRTETLRERHVQSHINSGTVSSSQLAESQAAAAAAAAANTTFRASSNQHSPIGTRFKHLNSSNSTALNLDSKKTVTKSDSKNTDPTQIDYKSKIMQMLKSFSRKRKANAKEQLKRFRKANYKDFFDACSLQLCTARLQELDFRSGHVTFTASILASKCDPNTGVESFLVEWSPKNIIECEWVERDKLQPKKTLSLDEMSKQFCKDDNILYRPHRFRKDRRK